jgi:hypothetical protein
LTIRPGKGRCHFVRLLKFNFGMRPQRETCSMLPRALPKRVFRMVLDFDILAKLLFCVSYIGRILAKTERL